VCPVDDGRRHLIGNSAKQDDRLGLVASAVLRDDDGDPLSHLRRTLLRLALEQDEPAAAVQRACRIVSVTLGAHCAFAEDLVATGEIPGYVCVSVRVRRGFVGTLLLEETALAGEVPIGSGDVEEIAELIGLCAVQAFEAQEIQELEEQSAEMLFHAPDAILAVARDGAVTMANRRALELVGLTSEEVVGAPLRRALGRSAPGQEELARLAASGAGFELELEGAQGRRLASFTPSLVGDADSGKLLLVGRDVTSERQAELAMRRSERSALMSQTVEYLLHELNNPLAALIANLGQASRHAVALKADVAGDERRAKAADRLGASLEQSKRAAERIDETTRILRAARKGSRADGPELVDVDFEIGLAVTAFAQDWDAFRVVREGGAMPKIAAPPLHLAEVFGALLKNAAQAMGKSASGEIRVRTEVAGGRVVVAVEDDGPGVEPAFRDRIFMPFFTTKPLGSALGLGLTIAEDTVRRLGGRIRFEPAPGGGARFLVELPIHSA
jgi:two-component system, NtrC family, sensor histidine kinase PilS